MLQIIVKNNIRIRGATTPLRAAITEALTVDNPAYTKMKNMGRKTFGIEKKLPLYIYDQGDLVVPRGFKQQLIGMIGEKDYYEYAVYELIRPIANFGKWIGPTMRSYQIPAVEAVLDKSGGVLVSPAGSGKTLMGLKVISQWSTPTLWLTHTLDLMHQTAAAAQRFLGDVGEVGLIGEGKVSLGSGKLIIATVQTLNANPKLVELLSGMIGAIVVDEAHHFPSQQFIEVASRFPATYLLGLTATPQRKDGLQAFMFAGLGPLAHEVKRDGMYESGAIILPEIKFVYTQYTSKPSAADLEGLGADLMDDPDVVAGWVAGKREVRAANNVDAGGEDIDFQAMIQDLTADESRANLIAENILESCINVNPKGGAVIVLADNVRYLFVLRNLVAKFSGVRLGGNIPRMHVIHGGLSKYVWRKCKSKDVKRLQKEGLEVRHSERLRRYEVKTQVYSDAEFESWQVRPKERQQILADAREGKVDIIFATSQLVKEGLDIPNLYDGHMATPQKGDARGTKNGSGIEQAIGRIMRPDPNNAAKKATWFDYVDGSEGIFYDQYLSRRKVYTRLGCTLGKKPRTKKDSVQNFLLTMDLPLF